MSHIFGPVPTRRLGLSLGVDLIPSKTCTYDCIYCEVGRTTCHTIDAESFIAPREIEKELGIVLEKTRPDTITLAGSGEPTLNSAIDEIISVIRKKTGTKIALLTNGSLLWREDVLRKVLSVDIILPTFSTVFDNTFAAIHRPCAGLNPARLIKGLKDLRNKYKGLIFLEVILLSGMNDTEKEIEGLRQAIMEISPDKIQLNTVVRPPSDKRAKPVDALRMDQIRNFFGDRAEIIAYAHHDKNAVEYDSGGVSVIEMARRRPVRLSDIAEALHRTTEDTERLVKELLLIGEIAEQEHEGETFYIATTTHREI
jgi:wyosine [tRNA(Phe)-imidazoG37] synthetase (radical SAM superfamily)